MPAIRQLTPNIEKAPVGFKTLKMVGVVRARTKLVAQIMPVEMLTLADSRVRPMYAIVLQPIVALKIKK